MKKLLLPFYLCLLTISGLAQKSPELTTVKGHVFKPEKVDASEERIESLKIPDGFELNVFAENLGKARMMAVTEDGDVYITRRDDKIHYLKDKDGDGKADVNVEAMALDQVHGLAIHEDWLYMVAVNKVYRAKITGHGALGEKELLIDSLPEGGQHPNRTIEFGPDGMMYLSVGSTCNACDETNEMNGTMMIANPDGSDLKIFCQGLRNTIGYGWHPQSGEMYGLDHGIDWLGDEEQKEELNHLVEGKHYGWPYIYGKGKHNPADEPPNKQSYEAFAATTTDPELLLWAHSAPIDMIFYRGKGFGADYENDIIATLHGSWNREKPVGYKVVRIVFEDGKPKRTEDLISGFLIKGNKAQFGRVTGLVQMPDGSLLIADDSNGKVYRLAYTGS